jgi:regulatory protein
MALPLRAERAPRRQPRREVGAGEGVGKGGGGVAAAADADVLTRQSGTRNSRNELKPRSPMQRAVAALARREYSRAELRAKLLRTAAEGDDAATVDAALDQLAAKGMLSDQRFAASRVRVRAQRFGAERIRRELKRYGLAEDVVRDAMALVSGSEIERAQQLWQRKFGVPPADQVQRAKQMRFLAARGFSAETVMAVMKTIRKG